jgi:hypothetical protein
MIDYFQLPGGRYIHPYEITCVAIFREAAAWVRRYQMTQESVDRIVLQLKVLRSPATEELERVRRVMEEKLGPKVDCVVKIVDDIPSEGSAKFRTSRSMVQSNYNGIDWTKEGKAGK